MDCRLMVVEPSCFEVTAKGVNFVPPPPLPGAPNIPPAGAGVEGPNIPPAGAGAPKVLPVGFAPNALFVAPKVLGDGAPNSPEDGAGAGEPKVDPNAGAGVGVVPNPPPPPNPPFPVLKPPCVEEVPEPNIPADGAGADPNIPPDGAGAGAPKGDDDGRPDPKPPPVEPNVDGAGAGAPKVLPPPNAGAGAGLPNPPPNPPDAGAGVPKVPGAGAPKPPPPPPNGAAGAPKAGVVFGCPKPLEGDPKGALEPNILCSNYDCLCVIVILVVYVLDKNVVSMRKSSSQTVLSLSTVCDENVL
mmetsp:Transcript_36257/g.87792  ORF Transcript_36257/g.87792 Transcript_36257/m.87792 type:complete len:300 (-) Transcript_36257:1621-2520(-)